MNLLPSSPLEHFRAVCLLVVLGLVCALVQAERQVGSLEVLVTAKPQRKIAAVTKITKGARTITETIVQACPKCTCDGGKPILLPTASKSDQQVISRTVHEEPTVIERQVQLTETPICPALPVPKNRFALLGYGLQGDMEGLLGLSIYDRFLVAGGLEAGPRVGVEPKIVAGLRF